MTVVILGECSVGKTSICKRLTDEETEIDFGELPTVASDLFQKEVREAINLSSRSIIVLKLTKNRIDKLYVAQKAN